MHVIVTSTDDAAEIAELHRAQLAEQGKTYSVEEVITRWRAVPHARFLRLDRGGGVGFVAYRPHGPGSIYLSDIYVVAAMRRRGLGRTLIQRSKQLAPSISLRVAEDNRAARILYESEGFVLSREDGDELEMHWSDDFEPRSVNR